MIAPILLVPYAAALVLVAFDLRGRYARRRIALPAWSPAVWCAVLLGAYAAELAILWWSAVHQLPQRVPPGSLPWPVVGQHTPARDAISALLLLIGALQCVASIALYRNAPSARVALVTGACMGAASLAWPALSSFDPYGYALYAALGRGMWAPPAVLPAQWHAIDLWLGSKSVGRVSPYGPLWLAIVQAIAAPAHGLLAKVFALRCAGIVGLAALLVAMRSLRLPWRAIVIAGLNPALWLEFVADAHNDVVPIALLALAAVLARRGNIVSAALVVAAALVKLPYALVGLPVLSALRPLKARLVLGAASVAGALLLSWAAGGVPYVRAIEQRGMVSLWWTVWHAPVALAALGFIGLAVVHGKRYKSAVWIVPSLGFVSIPIFFPWYFVWSLPYAFSRRSAIAHLLVGLPLVDQLTRFEFTSVVTLCVAYPLLVVWLCA